MYAQGGSILELAKQIWGLTHFPEDPAIALGKTNKQINKTNPFSDRSGYNCWATNYPMVSLHREFRKGLIGQFSPVVTVRQYLESPSSSVVSGATRCWPGIPLSIFVVLGFFMCSLPVEQLGFLTAWWSWGSKTASMAALLSSVGVPGMGQKPPALCNPPSEIMQNCICLILSVMIKSKACPGSGRGDINHTSPARTGNDTL